MADVAQKWIIVPKFGFYRKKGPSALILQIPALA